MASFLRETGDEVLDDDFDRGRHEPRSIVRRPEKSAETTFKGQSAR